MDQPQPNGSSQDKELSNIRIIFDKQYKNWLGQKGEEDENPEEQSNGVWEAKREETKSKCRNEIHGFDNEILSLRNFLLKQTDSEKLKTLAVVGKYGVGKTALCQKVFEDEEVKRAYAPRVWLCMYKTDQRKEENRKIGIVKRILENLGVEEEMFEYIEKEAREEGGGGEGVEENELARLLYLLYLNLWGKKYLIVLDDAREEDEWNERLDVEESNMIPNGNKWGTHLSCGFPKGSGGRVIITSRDEKLAKVLVGEQHNLHRLYPLCDPQSVWNIYKDAAAGFQVNPRNERKYKQDLMNKSCGFPLAVRMLGKNRPVEEDAEATSTQTTHTNGEQQPRSQNP